MRSPQEGDSAGSDDGTDGIFRVGRRMFLGQCLSQLKLSL